MTDFEDAKVAIQLQIEAKNYERMENGMDYQEQMQREDDTVYISMLSGGQDSTAMTLKMLENGYPIDYIVFCDTTLEHDSMYEYIDKIEAFIKRKYGFKIIRLKPKDTFEHWVFGKVVSGENKGIIRGVPRVSLPCFWRREAKENPFNRWVKKMGFKNYIKYIGYTKNETMRTKNMEEHNAVAPLFDWGWDEQDVQKYLKDNHMENKLYQHFNRTGCAVCPKQRLDDKYMVWKHHKKHWEYMVDVERRMGVARKENGEKDSPSWHDIYFCHEMEALFKKKDKQQTFEFDFEPVQDCFCKI